MKLLARALPLALLHLPAVAQQLTTELVASGLERPVWVGSAPQDDRIFVIEQYKGTIRILRDGVFLEEPFLDIDHLTSEIGDQGLLGMAFHPGFAQNGLFYVNYTDLGGDTDIARFRVSDGNPDVADPSSHEVLLEVFQPKANHNGGDLHFGPLDGYLYVPTGDGGGANDPDCRAQNPQRLQGKLLRVDVDGGTPYAIPPGNPFGDEVFAGGLRNPWRMCFDPANGDLYFGDVGQSLREEVNYVQAPLTGPLNFGWPAMEGDLCRQENVDKCVGLGVQAPECFSPVYTDPVHTYVNGIDGFCVIGGVVYRGCALPELHGTYLFADNNSGRFWSFRMVDGQKVDFQERTTELSGAGPRPVHFGYDPNGEILISDVITGDVSRVISAVPLGLADCDGDGQDDGCELAAAPWKDLAGNGILDACESFSADSNTISIGTGGLQNLALHAGVEQAGKPYLVLGSLSGTTPGLQVAPGLTLPLNLDDYLLLSLTAPNNVVPFTNSLGVLDGEGSAQAQIYVAPGILPSVAIGLVANHAYVTLDPSSAISFISNLTAVRFQS